MKAQICADLQQCNRSIPLPPTLRSSPLGVTARTVPKSLASDVYYIASKLSSTAYSAHNVTQAYIEMKDDAEHSMGRGDSICP